MVRTVSAMEFRKNFGRLLDEAYYRGDHIAIERAGRRLAVVVSADEYERWQRRREGFFELIEQLQEQNNDVDPDEAEREILAACQEVRAARAAH